MKHSAYITLTIFLLLSTAFCTLDAQEPTISVPLKSRGIPAYPFPEQVKQPDGTVITLRAFGDRMLQLYETEDGYTVLRDKKGNYMYATKDAEQRLVPSEVAVAAAKGAPNGIEKHLRCSSAQVDAAEKAYYPDVQSKSNPNPFPATGTNNVLVILAEFQDRDATLPASEIQNMLSAPNYNGTGSFRDYYMEVSYNNLILEPYVAPWVQVSGNMAYYGENDAFGYDIRPDVLVRETVDSLEANGFDFSPFDNDGDGYVDEIILIHSGYGEQYTGSGDTAIWSHAFHLADNAVTYDGVVLDNYIIGPELFGSSGAQPNPIGTVAHEFAHSLGIPDIYDVDLDGSGGYAFDPNFWDLMAVGSWNNNGWTPAGINAWLKKYLGWMTIPTINSTGTFTLNPAINNPEAYQLNTPVYNEYFIVENRQRIGFDSYIPGEGMLIYHVDLNDSGWLTGEINTDPSHQAFDIEEADNIRDTVTLGGDPFPGTANVTSFDSVSTPSSMTWDGKNSGVALQNITQTDDQVSFDILDENFSEMPAGWLVDELSYTQQGSVTAAAVLEMDTVVTGYLGVFVGNECRGISSVKQHETTGSWLFDLFVFSNSGGGELLEFKYFDPAADSIYALYETLEFSTGTIAGTQADPFVFHTPVRFTKTFSPGWNWFSLNVMRSDMRPDAIFTTCANAGDYVKNQTQSTSYYAGYGWFGTLDTLNNRDLYIVKVGSACGIDVTGAPAETAASTRNLAAGWNWVAYTPQVAMSPSEALASLSPTHLDYVKNQTQSATYYEGYGWFGTLELMQPGEGYMLRLAQADELTYPAMPPAGKKSLSQIGDETPSPDHPQQSSDLQADQSATLSSFNPSMYAYNGTVTATVVSDESFAPSEKDILTAWTGDERRGQVHASWFEPSGTMVFPLMVFGNNEHGDQLRFTYTSASTGETFSLKETILFSRDMILGNAGDALALHIDDALGTERSERFMSNIQVYPNPASEYLNITFELASEDHVVIELFDIYGSRVSSLADQYYPAGQNNVKSENLDLFPGNYILKFKSGNRNVYSKILIR